MAIQESLILEQVQQPSAHEVPAAVVIQDPRYSVSESVAHEVETMQTEGLDVAFVDPYDPHAATVEGQQELDNMAEYLEELEQASPGAGAELFLQPEAMKYWGPLTKRAIALHPLYRASVAKLLGDGITPDAYERPIFDATSPDGTIHLMSAKDVLFEGKTPEKAQKILDSYLSFIGAPIDPVSRLFYMASKDAAGVRTRAYTAMDMVRDHIGTEESMRGRQDLVSASLACGAAGPVYELVHSLREQGNDFSRVILVDKDEMALASASALAEAADVEEVVDIQRRDLLAEELTDYIEPGSADIVDLLGLYEYLPKDFGVMLLEKVKQIVRPGGMIVFGNMLNERPQQTLFSDVAKWPALEQRGVKEVYEMCERAGFSAEHVTTRVPARQGVYAVYAIKVPEASDTNGISVAA
ncbi:hypothetical protein E6P97_02990 [Patescibacteria group bacterium]|nr:MAG: hypothetical protein E6P97_02990 [Patescibacteria group bacterium]